MRTNSADTSSEYRLSVLNLDSVSQAQSWIYLGPERAKQIYISLIRAALLLAPEIIIDRNQLLDGAFFRETSPEELRWHLGLAPNSQIPITVLGSRPPDAKYPNLDDVKKSFAQHQIDELKKEGTVLSVDAVLQTNSASKIFLYDYEQKSSNNPPSKFTFETNLNQWVKALSDGTLRTEHWAPIKSSLQELLKGFLDSTNPIIKQIAQLQISELEKDQPQDPRTRRSLIVRWIDGQTVKEFDPPLMPSELSTLSAELKRRAYNLWNEMYYRSNADANKIRMLNVFDGMTDDSAPAPDDATAEITNQHALSVKGEIFTDLEVISPHNYAQLRSTLSHDLWKDSNNRRLNSLALTVKRSADIYRTKPLRNSLKWLRFTAIALIAIVIGTLESDVLPGPNNFWIPLTVTLAFATAFPWNLMIDLFSTSPSRLQTRLHLVRSS